MNKLAFFDKILQSLSAVLIGLSLFYNDANLKWRQEGFEHINLVNNYLIVALISKNFTNCIL
jgi:hypothetical protein